MPDRPGRAVRPCPVSFVLRQSPTREASVSLPQIDETDVRLTCSDSGSASPTCLMISGTIDAPGCLTYLRHRRSAPRSCLIFSGTGQPALRPRRPPALRLSYDIELSFLPISRARLAPSATQLSSARGRRPARQHVHAAWESAEVVPQAPWQANFVVTSDRSEASETGKPDSLSDED